MVAFFASLLALVVFTALPFGYGKRRPVGTPITWGEAVGGALYLFFVMFWAYGIVPHQFLTWADGPLNWRADAYGVPAGKLQEVLGKYENHWYSHTSNSLWPTGITFFGRGRILVNKQHIRDVIAATIYIVFLGVQIFVWTGWQKRGKKAAAKAALEPTSTYGRPLVKKA